jgi:hypothetical protein
MAFASESPGGFIVYKGINPNAKDIVAHTFKDCLSQGWIPGICYKTSKPMATVAKGTVIAIEKLQDAASFWKSLGGNPAGAKGFKVSVAYGNNFRSNYLHLKMPDLKFGQKVKRGQIIGFADERWNSPMLVLTWAAYIEVINPENYGINHLPFVWDWCPYDLHHFAIDNLIRFENDIHKNSRW